MHNSHSVQGSSGFACCDSILRGDVAALYAAVCELFEMYLLHTLRAFADMPIARIVSPTEAQVSALVSYVNIG